LRALSDGCVFDFIRWHLAPPSILLKDCGTLSATAALTQGPEAPAAREGQVTKTVRDHVALYLSELIGCIAKGTLHPATGLEQREGEYDVTIYRTPGESLFLNIGNWQERVVVMGFRPGEDGQAGSLQRSGRVRENDILIAINGKVVSEYPFKDVSGADRVRMNFDMRPLFDWPACEQVIDLLQKAHGFMTLRFVKSSYRDLYLDRSSRNRYVAQPKEVNG